MSARFKIEFEIKNIEWDGKSLDKEKVEDMLAGTFQFLNCDEIVVKKVQGKTLTIKGIDDQED